MQLAFAEAFGRVTLRNPLPLVPEHDSAAAVFALRNRALKVSILQRVIFDLDGQRFDGRVEAWSLGNGPALEHAIPFQAEVVMKMAGIVLLNAIVERFL